MDADQKDEAEAPPNEDAAPAPPPPAEPPPPVPPVAPKTRGRKRKARAPKDATAPRQPLTGYVRYLNERRETLRADNPRLGFAEVTRRLAQEWSRLPADEKRRHLDAAERDRERYVREWAAYKETDAYAAFRRRQLERKEDKRAKADPERAEPDAEPPAPPPPSAPSAPKLNGGPAPPPADGRHPEVDVPIFTEQFLQHNKLRETELRQLRKTNADFEQQNAILQKHIESMRGVVDRTKSETAEQAARTQALHSHLKRLVERLVSAFGSTSLPGGPAGADEQNIEQYMERLRTMAAENKNAPVVKEARDLLIKMELV